MNDVSKRSKIDTDLERLLEELMKINFFKENELCVIGCSTSEVIGERIGTMGSMDVAELIYTKLDEIQSKTGVHFVFQGCEHINRALTMESAMLEPHHTVVDVMPVKSAGGSMSQYAYQHMQQPVVIEHVTAQCGIDIGQTMIGMHIQHVAVPVRTNQKVVGNAIVTICTSRPKKIGGNRAQYHS